MTKPDPIDPKTAFAEVFKRTGGIAGMTSWAKTHRTLFYGLFAKLISQPLVQNNVAVNVNADGEAARRQLETAFMRVIEARKHDGDPAVYVDGERLIEHQPATREPPPSTADHGDAPSKENLKSPQKGPLNGRGGVAEVTGGDKNRNFMKTFPSIPGLAAGAALDESADNRSTTEKFLNWSGRRMP
jgi:hypothetical protein